MGVTLVVATLVVATLVVATLVVVYPVEVGAVVGLDLLVSPTLA